MKLYNVTTPKKFESNGEEKTAWLPVGSMRMTDDNKIFIELNHNPGITYMAFPSEGTKKKVESDPEESPRDEVDVDSIPF